MDGRERGSEQRLSRVQGGDRWGEEGGAVLVLSLPPVSDGPTKLQALNLTEGSTVLHWDPPQNPVDTYDVQVTAPEGERG